MSDSKDIENIHKRYTFTLINPSSFYVSLFASVGIAAIISALVFHNFIQNYEILYHLPAVIAVSDNIHIGYHPVKYGKVVNRECTYATARRVVVPTMGVLKAS